MRFLICALVALALVTVSSFAAGTHADQPRPAAIQLQDLTARAHGARVRGDWGTFRATAQEIVGLLNGSPDALLDLARGKAHTGDERGALADLQTIAAMGQSRPIIEQLPDFASIRGDRDFKIVLQRMTANATALSFGKPAFTIADRRLLPEDIDYDAATAQFFLTSVLEKKIAIVDRNGRLRDFAKSPSDWPMLALKVDAKRRIVWATEVALDGFSSVNKRDWGRSAVLAYDADSGKLLRRIEGPRPSALGDMALDSYGNVLVSDGNGGGVYSAGISGPFKRVDAGDFISPQTPAFIPGTSNVFVPDYVRGLGILNIRTRHVRWIPMENRYALEGIDGLYFVDNTLIAVENGTSPERVIRFQLDSARTHVTSARDIERATPNIDPTHGVVVGSEFYYISNAGWDALGDNGAVKRGLALSFPRIMRAPLSDP